VDAEKVRVKDIAMSLQRFTQEYFSGHKEKMVRMMEVLKHRPAQIFKSGQRDLSDKTDRLNRSLDNKLKVEKTSLAQFEKIIEIVHPDNTLRRGFSITRNKENKVIRSIKDVRSGEVLITQVFDGQFESEKN
jgi:exodeoxyribonuclease VII large subunit